MNDPANSLAIGTTREAEEVRPSRWPTTAIICVVLAAITFAVFGQTFWHGFVDYDDDAYVYENPVVAQGLTPRGIAWAFTSSHAANWHPLTWISHMLDVQWYGLQPGGHHFTNVLLHTLTVMALFLILREMTGALWRSAFVAAVFAIHPLRVESVAWVAERKDVLSGLFFVLTIGAYARYARRPGSWGRYALVVVLFAMGLMCKPMLVTLPLVLLLLDYWPLERKESIPRLVVEKLPLLALSAAGCAVTLFAQQQGIQSTGAFLLPMRLGNALVACMIYLRQMVYPAGLVAFYPYPLNGLPIWEVVLAGVLFIGFSAAALLYRRKYPWMLTGWGWYVVMLLPVLGIVQVGDQSHADRYTYLPQIGVYVAVTWLVAGRLERISAGRALAGGLMAGIVGVLMVCAWKQTAYWKDSYTLWNHALSCAPRNGVAEFNLANAFRRDGKMDDAVAHYEKALAIMPNYGQADDNLGHILLEQGKIDEAIDDFKKAAQINPRLENAHFNLGTAYRQEGRTDEAMAEYQKALQINPDFGMAHADLGMILYEKGRVDEAIPQYEAALRINPGLALAHFNLGVAYLQERKPDEAIPQLQAAVQIRPKYMMAHNYLATALLQRGRIAEAISHFQAALQISPSNPAILDNLAWLLATSADETARDGKRAVELAEEANQITKGNNPMVLCTLAAGYAEAGQFPRAIETAQQALQLADRQSNVALAAQLKFEIQLYQGGRAFHIPAAGKETQ